MAAESAIDTAVVEIESLNKLLKKSRQTQVRSNDEKLAIRGTARAWFKSHKPEILAHVGEQPLKAADQIYLTLLESSERAGSRSKYFAQLKELKRRLIQLRSLALSANAGPNSEALPDFSRLVSNPAMQTILAERWIECVNCLRAPAPLAATVMMGGLLEGLLLARINREKNQAPIFTAKAAPKKDGKAKRLSEWTLYDFISVAHELEWITVSAKSVGHVLRDYRNYIHPQKQLAENVSLRPDDAALWWEMVKAIARELL